MLLPSGESWTLALTVKPAVAGTIAHRVTAYAVEPDSHPENDGVTTSVIAK